MSHDSTGTTFVGMDVHKAKISVAVLRPGVREAEVHPLPNEAGSVKRWAGKLVRAVGGEVVCVYEAGCCGYVLQRQLKSLGLQCQVIAPSLVPKRPGDRVKTDRRDALQLAQHARAGLLTVVQPPTSQQEAVRDLVRCREDAREDLQRARQRVSKLLLRRGIGYRGKGLWGDRHRAWLWGLKFGEQSERVMWESYLTALDGAMQRLAALDQALGKLAEQEPYREPVGRLRCLRGVDTLTALCLVAELYDVARFATARQLMAYVGLVPSEHSSGASIRRGGITKAGNRHARRLLVEAAWHARHSPAVGVVLKRRREGQSLAVIAMADRAQKRLHQRYMKLVLGRGKTSTVAVTAVARELAGFVWAILNYQPGFAG